MLTIDLQTATSGGGYDGEGTIPVVNSPGSISTTSLSPRALDEFFIPAEAGSDASQNIVYAPSASSLTSQNAMAASQPPLPQPPSNVKVVSTSQQSQSPRNLGKTFTAAGTQSRPLKLVGAIPATRRLSKNQYLANRPQLSVKIEKEPSVVQTVGSNQPLYVDTGKGIGQVLPSSSNTATNSFQQNVTDDSKPVILNSYQIQSNADDGTTADPSMKRPDPSTTLALIPEFNWQTGAMTNSAAHDDGRLAASGFSSTHLRGLPSPNRSE